MNSTKLRTKRVLIPAIATVALLGVGGTVWSATADDVDGNERDRVGTAAVEAVGGGTAVDVETSDDRGEAYEVEVRTEDGTEVDVALDQDLGVVGEEVDGRDDDVDEARDDDGDDDRDADDRALSASERTSAERAALDAVGGGTVEHVEASDDRGEAYEVDVLGDDGSRWDVSLDADFGVLRKTTDD
jgi:uncharacterized membrane protein YkoI